MTKIAKSDPIVTSVSEISFLDWGIFGLSTIAKIIETKLRPENIPDNENNAKKTANSKYFALINSGGKIFY